MSSFKKFILIVLLAGVMLITVYVYFIFLNTSKLTIKTGGGDYSVYLNDEAYPCFSDPCELQVKSGSYELRLDKPGYYLYTDKIQMSRAGEIELNPILEEIPRLKESSFSKEMTAGPSLPSSPEGTLGGTWNESQNRYLFLDAEDEKLKIRDLKGESKVVTTLKNLNTPVNFFWSPNEREAIVASGNEIYFIRTELGSRSKFIADFEASRALWTPVAILLGSEGGSVYKVDPDSFNEATGTNLEIELGNSLTLGGQHLLSYELNGNATRILLIDLERETEEIIAEKLDFLVDDIYYDSALSIAYFRESESQTWYEIKIKK